MKTKLAIFITSVILSCLAGAEERALSADEAKLVTGSDPACDPCTKNSEDKCEESPEQQITCEGVGNHGPCRNVLQNFHEGCSFNGDSSVCVQDDPVPAWMWVSGYCMDGICNIGEMAQPYTGPANCESTSGTPCAE